MKAKISLFALLIMLLLLSCSKSELEISTHYAQPFIISEDSRMGISIYVKANDEPTSFKEMTVKDPTGQFEWTLPAEAAEFEGSLFLGSADAVMPLGVDLPQGEWSLRLVSKDGRVCNYTFHVSYKDPQGALERTASGYDELSNLTVI
ncbi:MAG: hypothetical protein K5634_04210 [Sphaerochaetaceae bacterium]|nr:hypothetical protein [Sphaerochaetaceae bacterium]